jgi:tRNA(fMet)-specific endonuclease VapC
VTSAHYLLDTNICIYIQRNQPPEVFERFQRLKPGEAVISVVTWGEFLYGAEKSQHQAKVLELLEEFAAMVPVLPMGEKVGHVYGVLRAMLAAQGKPIGSNDLWIAAHAKAEGLTLVSNNDREFKRITGLKLSNWATQKTI